MPRHLPEQRTGWLGLHLTMVLLAALCWSPAAGAVAPPVALPEEAGPGPLLDFEPPQADPLRMSLAVIGSGFAPLAGPMAAAGALQAGEQGRAWDLEGPLTSRYSRTVTGATTLVLAGFNPFSPPGMSELGTLLVGANLDCWVFINTDRFRGLPGEWLQVVRDGPLTVGGPEAEIYARVLTRAHYTSVAAFKNAARRDVGYIHMLNEPDRYRGSVVNVTGRLLRVNRFDPPPESLEAGINDLYEAWIHNETFGSNPYCVLFTVWPEDLPKELLGETRIKQFVRVSVNGYFFKKWTYRSSDKNRSTRATPLIISRSLVYLNDPPPARKSTDWLHSLMYVFVSLVAGLIVGAIGLSYWFRRSDRQVRDRILARMPEFVLPPPDSIPQATPVSSPVRPYNTPGEGFRIPLAPRVIFPSSSKDLDKGSSDPSSKDSGSDSPDEDASRRPRP